MGFDVDGVFASMHAGIGKRYVLQGVQWINGAGVVVEAHGEAQTMRVVTE